jgi:hypothetical protein
MVRSNGSSPLTRAAAFALAGALASCSGGGNRLLPAAGGFAPNAAGTSPQSASRRYKIPVRMRIRIPRRTRDRVRIAHPSTISSLTQSVGISINGGAQLLFNTTPSSPGCVAGPTGIVCTFNLSVAPGTVTFAATTYTAPGGSGTAIDHGVAQVPITVGKANSVVISLGPVVSTTNDSGIGSLRYAVATAGSGDTIMFLLPPGSIIGLNTPVTISGNVTIAGPGVSPGDITVSGGGATQIFNVTGNATISGLILTGGKAVTPGRPGGAVGNTGTLTLANNSIGNSTSIVSIRRAPRKADLRLHPHCTTTYNWGGAVYNTGVLTTSGNTFNGNLVKSDLTNCLDGYGGAIFNDVNAVLTSSGDTFTNNSAYEGGAVYNSSGAAPVRFTGDTFTGNTTCTSISGCPTTGCNNSGCTSYAQGSGGAIYDTSIGVTIDSSAFNNNAAGGATTGSHGQGGALVLVNGFPVVTNSTFTGNLAGGGSASCSEGEGGAIVAIAPLEIDGDTFANNQSTGDNSSIGGAIFANATITGTGDTFTSNAAIGSGSACATSSQGAGGAIFAAAAVTLGKSTFNGNGASGNAEGSGGAMQANGATLTGDTFTSNAVVGTGAQGASPTAGGGAAALGGLAKLIGDTFSGNSAKIEAPGSAYGGALVGGGLINSTSNTYASNTVTATAGTGLVTGGAVSLASGTLNSIGDTFKSNSATGTGAAGGGALMTNGLFTINDATFTSNSVTGGTNGEGGAFAAQTTAGTVSNSTFTGNAATGGNIGAGGAIFDEIGSQIQSSKISQNTASGGGGGIINGGTEVISDSTISGNTVTNASMNNAGGGGILAANTVLLERSTVSNNAVTVSGPGTAGGGGIMNDAGLIALESTISGNTVLGSAPNSGGGGVYNLNGATFFNSTISNNTSHIDGGGIEIASNNMVALINATVYQNAATGNGGNIDNLFTTLLANSIVAGGSANIGSDVFNSGTMNSGDYNIIQTQPFPGGGTFGGTTTHNLAGDPHLLGLSNNGGPTFTNADQLHGPGQGVIPFIANQCNGYAVTTDQRLYTRGTGGFCDIGAFEFNAVPSASRPRTPPPPLAVKRHANPFWAKLALPPMHWQAPKE